MATTDMVPRTVNIPSQCPFCGQLFDYTLYPEITMPGDRKLKKKVLNKTLFFPKCPHCGQEVKLKPGCIYRNETKKEMFVVTEKPDLEIEKMMKTGDIHFNDIRTDDDVLDLMKSFYVRRVVHDVDAFREKILLSDCNYDDRIIELMKLSLSQLMEKETHTPVYRIFLDDTSGNDLVFTAIMGARAPFEYMTIKSSASVYTQYKSKYLKKLGRPELDEYITTDQKWAKASGILDGEDAGYVAPVNED